MSLNTQLSDAAANAACNALTALVNSGSIKFYSGSQPPNGNSSPTGTLLATLPLNTTAFAAAASGAAAMNTGTAVQAAATATGTAGYFTVCDSGGNVRWMGSVGTSGCNVNMGTTSIVSGATVQVNSYTFTVNEAGN